MTALPLLLEIGTEELPSSFVDAALAALPGILTQKLAELRLGHGAIVPLGTPRRLAFIIQGVATSQPDLDEEITGPPEAAAFKDGKPTKAAEAFAAKLGIAVSELTIVDRDGTSAATEGSADVLPARRPTPQRGQHLAGGQKGGKQKPGRYVAGRRLEKGRAARELLGKALAEIAAQIPFRKSMRWGEGETAFGRPVQWLVALFGADVVDVSFAHVRSGRVSRGHRFLAPAKFDVKDPDSYVSALRERHVKVDREERARTMMAEVAAAAIAAGGVHDPEPSLVDENASLVEEPHAVLGSFEPRFLTLPAAVIRAVARGHQKYFCVQKSDDVLLPHYVVVANTANDPAKIAKGNDRVMRARLADAQFFFEEDKKADIEDRVEKLGGIVFHNRLGTVKEKVLRIEKLSVHIADALGQGAAEKARIRRAAHLSKFDLVSLMVGEFPELQGHMGRAYAKNAGEEDAVADAVRDHYRPVGAQDAIPEGQVALVVALADRLDTLTGCFAVGLAPTGAADPFALRRNCIAALRILMETGTHHQEKDEEEDPKFSKLGFSELVRWSYGLVSASGKKLDLSEDETVAKLTDFAAERLRGLLAGATSNPVSDAILGGTAFVNGRACPVVEYPAYASWKAVALQSAVNAGETWLRDARAVAKRMHGISKTAEPRFHAESELGESAADRAKNGEIVRLVRTIDSLTTNLASSDRVEAALRATKDVALGLERIFTNTLVNDPNDPYTQKRLELISFAARCMLRIADFSGLAQTQ